MNRVFRPAVEISVVAPMNNEELCAREFCLRVDAVLKTLTDSYEIVVVDDGSTDRTAEILDELTRQIPELRPVPLTRNCGQWAAAYAGIQHSVGQYVVVMDSDLQHLPEEIPLLIQEIRQGYDLVSGTRGKRKENMLSRRLPSLAANYLMRATTGCQIRDMGGFKCLRGDIARELRLRAGQHRLLPALVHLMGGSLSEVIVSAPPRFAGRSHYGFARSLDVLFDIVMLWFQSSFKSRPLYLFGRVSLWLFTFGSAVLGWLLYEKFARGIDMGNRPPFLATIVIFLASMGFMSVGFVLEILSDTLNALTGRKPYRIRIADAPPDEQEDSLERAA
jgi:glycosyltransferase involved in cell wall biosynthesis